MHYSFDDRHYTTSETWTSGDAVSAAFTYERDPTTRAVTALTLTCPDRRGLPLRHTSIVRPGQEERVKEELSRSRCYWDRAPAGLAQ